MRNATWGGLAFTATTAVIVIWGITTLIGVRASLTDLRTGLAFRLGRLAAPLSSQAPARHASA